MWTFIKACGLAVIAKITIPGPKCPATLKGAMTAYSSTFAGRDRTRHDSTLKPKQHGLEGLVLLVSTASTKRDYALRGRLQKAWSSAGVEKITNPNSGSPLGVGDAIECHANGERINATNVYQLKGVSVYTETLVNRIVLEEQHGQQVATDVETADGRITKAEREVILSAGAPRSPKVLLLSGVGPS